VADSNFTEHEIRGLTIAFIALVVLNGVLFIGFSGGTLTEDSDVPTINPGEYSVGIVGDLPNAPGSTSENGSVNTYSYNSLNEGDTYGLDSEWFANPLELRIDNIGSYQVIFSLRDNVAGGPWVQNTVGYQNKITVDSGLENFMVDIYFEKVDSNTVSLSATVTDYRSGNSGFFGGLVYLAQVIGYGIGAILEFAINAVIIITQIAVFVFELMAFMVIGWGAIIAETGEVSPFLTLIVTAPNIALLLYVFNGIAKIIKMIPTT